jgi:hypothetical protein
MLRKRDVFTLQTFLHLHAQINEQQRLYLHQPRLFALAVVHMHETINYFVIGPYLVSCISAISTIFVLVWNLGPLRFIRYRFSIALAKKSTDPLDEKDAFVSDILLLHFPPAGGTGQENFYDFYFGSTS